MAEQSDQNSGLSLTADIVGAYVSKNSLPASALTDLVAQVHQALSALSSSPVIEKAPASRAGSVN